MVLITFCSTVGAMGAALTGLIINATSSEMEE